MLHFHGGPITPDTCALKAWKGRHAFISFANPGQLPLASEVCQSFALDNGAFSFWTKKRVVDWQEYYAFVARWANHPRFSFAVIPDVIGGGQRRERRSYRRVAAWKIHRRAGVAHERTGRKVCAAVPGVPPCGDRKHG